jgi:hypothetical protein
MPGLSILDHLGNERGGYGTAGVNRYSEAFVTLDDAGCGEVFQVVANANANANANADADADADAGVTLALRNRNGATALLTTFRDGLKRDLAGPGGKELTRWPSDAPALRSRGSRAAR